MKLVLSSICRLTRPLFSVFPNLPQAGLLGCFGICCPAGFGDDVIECSRQFYRFSVSFVILHLLTLGFGCTSLLSFLDSSVGMRGGP